MVQVIVQQATDYDDPQLMVSLKELLAATAAGAVRPGSRVLIKPNLLMPARPEQAILTHPVVVRAAVEFVLDCGGRPTVGDSPAIGSFDKILRQGGYIDGLSGLDVPCRPFQDSVTVDIGEPFHRIELARETVEADAILNLAKLKTHTQMLMTLGVKNTFGCVVGFRKPKWHLRSGVDRDHFARLLVQIHRAVAPCATVIDGILALDGQGPGKSGTPRHLGCIVGSASAAHADAAVCDMLGFSPDRLPTHRAAEATGLTANRYSLKGPRPQLTGFRLPTLGRLTFGPKPMQRIMRRHLIQRPVVDAGRCAHCGECTTYCPAGAVTLSNAAVAFDYDRCIRCYCCVEICPHGALQTADTRPGRLIHRLSELLPRRWRPERHWT